MIARTKIPPDEALRFAFWEADAASGLISNFGPLRNAALGSSRGSPNNELAINDKRYNWHNGLVKHARLVRKRLLKLSPLQRAILYAVYGPIDWHRRIDQDFGIGTGQKVGALLGSFIGVAFLVDLEGMGVKRPARLSRKFPWNHPAGWLVHACTSKQEKIVQRVHASAIELFCESVAAWWKTEAA